MCSPQELQNRKKKNYILESLVTGSNLSVFHHSSKERELRTWAVESCRKIGNIVRLRMACICHPPPEVCYHNSNNRPTLGNLLQCRGTMYTPHNRSPSKFLYLANSVLFRHHPFWLTDVASLKHCLIYRGLAWFQHPSFPRKTCTDSMVDSYSTSSKSLPWRSQ